MVTMPCTCPATLLRRLISAAFSLCSIPLLNPSPAGVGMAQYTTLSLTVKNLHFRIFVIASLGTTLATLLRLLRNTRSYAAHSQLAVKQLNLTCFHFVHEYGTDH